MRTKLLISCCFLLLFYTCKKEGEVKTLSLALEPSQKGRALPQNFIGLSYEMTEITSSTYFSPDNATLIQLIKNFGSGVLRIGAAGVDRCYWANGPRLPATPNNAITTSDVDRFAAFSRQIKWPVIFGLNLADFNPGSAASEAAYVSKKMSDNLLSFEIGNEPDIYDEYGYRSSGYTYARYKIQFDAYVKALRTYVPNAPISGPAISYKTTWSTPFAADEKNISKLLTAHHYPMSPVSHPTIDRLLTSITSLQEYCRQLQTAATQNGMPYRIAECNSVSAGGIPGISNTLASALWGLDMMWTIANNGGSGVNFHGGNAIYTPIELLNGKYTAKPLYYGMMAFAAGAQGNVIPVNFNTHGVNITAYATVDADNALWLTVINKTSANPIILQIDAGRYINTYEVQRLQGSGLGATDGITFAGSAVQQDGNFAPSAIEHYLGNGNSFVLNLQPASAAVIQIQ